MVILYKPNSEHDTKVQNYVRGFQQVTGKSLSLLDADSREGVDLARLHDIVQFPAIVASEDDGSFIESWPDMDKWPTASELSYYAK